MYIMYILYKTVPNSFFKEFIYKTLFIVFQLEFILGDIKYVGVA